MTPRRILICRTGAMGDVLHALPAVAALRRERPQWRIGWVVDPRWAALIAHPEEADGPLDSENPDVAVESADSAAGLRSVVDRIHLADTRLWSKDPFSRATRQSILRLRADLREQRYDLAVDMQGILRSAVIARLSGAPQRAGYSNPRESLAAHLYTQPLRREGAHVVAQGAHLLSQACGVPLQPAAFDLPRAAWADAWAAELADGEPAQGRPICVLAPSAGWGAKRWPVQRFGELAQELRALGFSVLVNAPRKEDALVAEVVAASAQTAQSVVCNVAGLTALLRRTALLVGGDSGPLHLAAALAVPLVALFGPTDPARNGPWGEGPRIVLRDAVSATSYKRSQELDPGLARIGVAAVVQAVRQLI